MKMCGRIALSLVIALIVGFVSPFRPPKLICFIITELALIRINTLNNDVMSNHVSQNPPTVLRIKQEKVYTYRSR